MPRSAATLRPIVIRFGRLGDMVLLSPLLQLLSRRYGMPCWLIGSGPWSNVLYRADDHVARVWSLRGRHTPLLLGPTWWRVIWALRHSANSPVYVCEVAASGRTRRIRAALALAGVSAQRCLFLAEDAEDGSEHRIDGLLRFGRQTPAALQAADYPCTDADPAPQIKVRHQYRLERDAWIRARGWDGRPLVLIQPGSRQATRRRWRRQPVNDKAWPPLNWSELLRCMHESLPEARFVLCGCAPEQALLRRICLMTRLDAVAAVDLPLGQLLALCEVAHSMVSVDSGPAHVAAALGVPLVVLFGATSPRHWLPRGAPGAPVIGLGGPPKVSHVDQISVPEVFAAWRSLPTRH